MKYLSHFVAMMWREERRWLLAGAAASFLTLLSAIALLGLSGWFITAAGLAGLAGAGLTFDFFRPSAGIRFLALFRTAARYGERLATHDATLRFLASLRANLFASVARTRAASPSLRSSELLQRLTADLESIDSLYLRLLLPAATAVALAALASIVLASISPSFAIAIGAAFVAAVFAIYAGAHFARKTARRAALGTEAARVRTIDLLQAQTDLVLSGGAATQKKSIEKAARYLAQAGNGIARIDIGVSATIALTAAGLSLALLLLGGAAFETNKIDGPVMAMLVIGGFAALEVFFPLRRGAIELGRTAFSARRLHALASDLPENDGRIFARRGLAIAMLDMTYRARANAPALFKNYYFAVRRGERVALAGRSGSGKSTLLSLVAGLLKAESGNIMIGDHDRARPPLGYLTQQTELFRGTIAENLRIAAPEASEKKLWRALEIVELREKVEALDGKLEWQLGESGSGFSGGECRRLALARLVLRDPAIWLLDEPTAGMDEVLAQRVLDRIFRFAPNATFVIAAHHEREIQRAARVVRLA